MRTTIRIDEKLLQEAKIVAARRGTTLKSIIEDALRESLARQHDAPHREKVRLITYKGNGLLPGVDLDDSAALLDLMEAIDDPD
jgi:hypothetical protein